MPIYVEIEGVKGELTVESFDQAPGETSSRVNECTVTKGMDVAGLTSRSRSPEKIDDAFAVLGVEQNIIAVLIGL